MMNMETIGAKAGILWRTLNTQVSPLPLSLLEEKTEMNREEVFMALGWLARENKLYFSENDGNTTVSLMPVNVHL